MIKNIQQRNFYSQNTHTHSDKVFFFFFAVAQEFVMIFFFFILKTGSRKSKTEEGEGAPGLVGYHLLESHQMQISRPGCVGIQQTLVNNLI